MGLPPNGSAWPPPNMAQIRAKLAEWDAWYSNDVDALAAHYRASASTDTRQGVIKRAVRFFWGETRADQTKQPERKLHVPIASDIAQASSDLLFSEPPTLSVEPDTPASKAADGTETAAVTTTGDRLALICDAGFHQTLTSTAELTAALGGAYLRATWDRGVHPDRPFATKVDYDAAYPEFRFGILAAATFWTIVGTNGQVIYRHLERHETNADGIGVIIHGLYAGTNDNLGRALPFADHPATAWLTEPAVVEQLIDGNTISTLTSGLDVFHVPNVLPNRKWRHHPIGKSLGRSDFDGNEPVMDALDEAYTSLMRDVRLGKSMLIVPQGMLTNQGPGKGASFDQNEVFTGINSAPGSAADSKMQLEQVQFDIRVAAHEQTIMLLWNTIIRSAGYSAQTFGEGGDVAMTATEVGAKERRSYLTRDRKIRTFKPELGKLAAKLLAIDDAVFRSGANPNLDVSVDFADGVQDDQEALARTAQLLANALAASIETRVRLLHKDWDEDQIATEVALIKAENNVPDLVDPDTLGENGEGLSSNFGGVVDGGSA